MTVALFYLRCLQIGLHISELDLLSIGMVIDMFIEHGNDYAEDDEDRNAGQSDFDNF